MQAITSLANVLQPIMRVAQPLVQGFGVVSNLIQGNKQSQIQQNAINAQNQLGKLAADPASLAARVRALQQPLDQGLVSGVSNDVQGYLAERGLALSPSIQSQVMAQALGPYQLDEQKIASGLALEPFRDLGYLTEAAQRSGPGIANTSGFWNQFNQPKSPTSSNVNPINPLDMGPNPSATGGGGIDWSAVPGAAGDLQPPGIDWSQFATDFSGGGG